MPGAIVKAIFGARHAAAASIRAMGNGYRHIPVMPCLVGIFAEGRRGRLGLVDVDLQRSVRGNVAGAVNCPGIDGGG